MRSYSEAERCMMLLFAPVAEEKPLSRSGYKGLAKALSALGVDGADPTGDLTAQELVRLGASREDAENMLSRLERSDALEQHLQVLRRQGITLLTRISPEYPRRLRQVLGDRAPMLLYCAGNLSLFQTECVSLVGSRQLRQPGRRFSEALGRAAAKQDLTYVSGGAAGADTVGFDSAMETGGQAIVFAADSLKARMEQLARPLQTGRLLLVSEYGFDQEFSAQRAYSRNRLIHAMGQKVFAAQSDYGKGGTWNGVIENLKNGWSPVYMCDLEPKEPGTRGLLERGCRGAGMAELADLRALEQGQIGLF